MRETADFEEFSISLERNDARNGSHIGDCQADVKLICAKPYVKEQLDWLSPVAILLELYEFGAWEPEEMTCTELNRQRIVWLACCTIREMIDGTVAHLKAHA